MDKDVTLGELIAVIEKWLQLHTDDPESIQIEQEFREAGLELRFDSCGCMPIIKFVCLQQDI